MKLVLIKPPFYTLFGLGSPKMKTYPLNLLALATYLESKGIADSEVVDGDAMDIPGVPVETGDPDVVMRRRFADMVAIMEDPGHAVWRELAREIMSRKPDVVGITANSVNLDAAALIVAALKAEGVPTVIGGSHAGSVPAHALTHTGADYAIAGEGERALAGLLSALGGETTLRDVPSLTYRDKGNLTHTPRATLMDVETLPIPDRKYIDRARYFGDVIMTGRGCPHDCAYCASKTVWGRKVRLRSTASVMRELREIAANAPMPPHGRRVVKALDDTFTVVRKRTSDLLREIIAANFDFEFTAGVRCDTLDDNIASKMALAGFKRVTLGVESGSPRILEAIRKGETNAQVIRATELLRVHGISSHAFFMVGFPGETEEDVALSKRLIEKARPDYVEVNLVTPYPGTELYERLVDAAPERITGWYRWFHQGWAVYAQNAGFDVDKVYADFVGFASEWNRGH